MDLGQVAAVDSLLPMLTHMYRVLSDGAAFKSDPLASEKVMAYLVDASSLSERAHRYRKRFLDDARSRLRFSIRMRRPIENGIRKTIQSIREVANSTMVRLGRIDVTGVLAVASDQSSALWRDQVLSLVGTVGVITILIVAQFRSVVVALVGPVPNVIPLVVVFGSMGSFGMPLDRATMIVGSVAIALSVDDTIHYLTNLKLHLDASPSIGMPRALFEVQRGIGRALVSTSVIIVLGLAMLALSPFKPLVFLGILKGSAIVAALLADLVFLPSLILISPTLQNLLSRRLLDRRLFLEVKTARRKGAFPTSAGRSAKSEEEVPW